VSALLEIVAIDLSAEALGSLTGALVGEAQVRPARFEAGAIARWRAADVLVLNVAGAGGDGLAALRALVAAGAPPVLALAPVDAAERRAHALAAGAADAASHTAEPVELAARVRRLAGARRDPAGASGPVEFNGFRFDPATNALEGPSGPARRLTDAEAALLILFLQRPNAPISRDALAARLRRAAWSPFDRGLDMLVSRLRKKIETDPEDPQLIRTIRGVGYAFTGAPRPGGAPGS